MSIVGDEAVQSKPVADASAIVRHEHVHTHVYTGGKCRLVRNVGLHLMALALDVTALMIAAYVVFMYMFPEADPASSEGLEQV